MQTHGERPAAPRILIAEDDVQLCELVAILLEDAGYSISCARHGLEALDLLDDPPPALVLLDLRMPVMDGDTFARHLRARYGHRVPIVVMTAADHPALRAREVDAEGWLSKPFAPEELLRSVRAHLAP